MSIKLLTSGLLTIVVLLARQVEAGSVLQLGQSIPDLVSENAGTVTLVDQHLQGVLSNPTGGAVLGAKSSARVSITDNGKGLQFEFSSYTVREDEGSVLVGVTRGDDRNFPLSVDYATIDGTAMSGVDYTGVTNTLTFAAGEALKLFTVPVLNDSLKESNKSFRIVLSTPTGGGVLGVRKTATVTIRDNDPGVQFEFSNYWVGENENSVTVKLMRGRDFDPEEFTVDYATLHGTAVPREDYVETRGTLAFAVGEVSHEIMVPILVNESSTADRQFRIVLSNPSTGAVLGPTTTSTVNVLDATGMTPHSITGVASQPDGAILLRFAGGVHQRFKDYYDLYPLEVSTDLANWVPWITLQRTNASTNTVTYTVRRQADADQMFFRTAEGPFLTPYRRPTGPFPVGLATRWITDPSRRNRYGISTNGSFMISVWYPAVEGQGKLSPLADPMDLSNPYPYGATFRARSRSFFTHAVSGAPCDTAHGPYPVVLYSHGYKLYRSTLAETGPNLASHGYIVVAADHAEVSGTVFPDGSFHVGGSSLDDIQLFQDRVTDFKFILDQLEQWSRTDVVFARSLDLTKVTTMGHSFGGGSAAEAARTDGRVKAAILLDAYYASYAPELLQFGLSKPFLGIHSTEQGGDTVLYTHTSVGAYTRFTISPSLHAQFSDPFGAFYASQSLNTLSDWREVSRTINAWALWFLNKYLKGLEEPMPAVKDYPRITDLKQKEP